MSEPGTVQPEAPVVTEAPPGPPAQKRDERRAPPPVDRLPPFKVLLHNDDHNDMESVTLALIDQCSLDFKRAVLVMLEAHEKGVALVMVTHKEKAELMVEQLRSRRLVATMEAAE